MEWKHFAGAIVGMLAFFYFITWAGDRCPAGKAIVNSVGFPVGCEATND